MHLIGLCICLIALQVWFLRNTFLAEYIMTSTGALLKSQPL